MTQRIAANPASDATANAFLSGAQKALGMVPNLYKIVAQSGAALAFHMTGSAALQKTKISAALREQLAVAIAGVNRCDYCASAHTLLGSMRQD